MLCETTVQSYFPSRVYQHKEERRHDINNTSKYLWQMGEKYNLCPPISIDPIKDGLGARWCKRGWKIMDLGFDRLNM